MFVVIEKLHSICRGMGWLYWIWLKSYYITNLCVHIHLFVTSLSLMKCSSHISWLNILFKRELALSSEKGSFVFDNSNSNE